MKGFACLISTIMLLVTTGCASSFPTEISVQSNGASLPAAAVVLEQSGENTNISEAFKELYSSAADLPETELGETVQIKLSASTAPDTWKLYDYLLKEDGSPKYDERAAFETELTVSKNTAEFQLQESPALALSSTFPSEEDGVLRGFRLVCSWGEKQSEYLFCLKSDTSK